MANLGAIASRLSSGAFYAVGLGALAAALDSCLYTGAYVVSRPTTCFSAYLLLWFHVPLA